MGSLKMDKILAKHVIELDPHVNGGEAVILTTEFFGNGDTITEKDGVFVNQEIELQSYGNAAAIKLYSNFFTPEFLRRWANELEQVRNKLVK